MVGQTQPRRIAESRSAPGAAGRSRPCPPTAVGLRAWAIHPIAGNRAALGRCGRLRRSGGNRPVLWRIGRREGWHSVTCPTTLCPGACQTCRMVLSPLATLTIEQDLREARIRGVNCSWSASINRIRFGSGPVGQGESPGGGAATIVCRPRNIEYRAILESASALPTPSDPGSSRVYHHPYACSGPDLRDRCIPDGRRLAGRMARPVCVPPHSPAQS